MHLEIKWSQENPMQVPKTNVGIAAWDICTMWATSLSRERGVANTPLNYLFDQLVWECFICLVVPWYFFQDFWFPTPVKHIILVWSEQWPYGCYEPHQFSTKYNGASLKSHGILDAWLHENCVRLNKLWKVRPISRKNRITSLWSIKAGQPGPR